MQLKGLGQMKELMTSSACRIVPRPNTLLRALGIHPKIRQKIKTKGNHHKSRTLNETRNAYLSKRSLHRPARSSEGAT
jgi:hypothetical protein